MPIELNQETITINESISQDYFQIAVEGDIIVPDSKPDVADILLVDAKSKITSRDVQTDRAILGGATEFNILYRPEGENTAKSITGTFNFSHVAETPGSRPDMKAISECDTIKIAYNVQNCRKVSVSAEVVIGLKVQKTNEISFLSDITGDEDPQILSKSIKAVTLAKEGQYDLVIADKVEVPVGKPSISEILKINVNVSESDIKVINNKVILKGSLNVQTLYSTTGMEKGLSSMEHEIPFTEILDVEGITEDMPTQIKYSFSEIKYYYEQDDDNEIRVVLLEIGVEVEVLAYDNIDAVAIIDTYCPNSNMALEKTALSLENRVADIKTQISGKEFLTLGTDQPRIEEIYYLCAKAYITDAEVENDRIKVSGYIDANVIYDSIDGALSSYSKEIDFSHYIDCEGVRPGMLCECSSELSNISYNLSGNSEIDIRYNITVSAQVISSEKAEIITNAELVPTVADTKKPSLLIYFVQKNDNLWDIAKRYNVRINSLLEANAMSEDDSVKEGMKLLIPKE